MRSIAFILHPSFRPLRLIQRAGLRLLAPALLMFVIGGAWVQQQAAAQPNLAPAAQGLGQQGGICPALVDQALQALEQNCNGLGRNAACYGYDRVAATFNQPVEPEFFSQPADRADLVTLQTITTAALDIDNNQWGVALMNAQANLPGSLPGQSVTFLLLGDATVVNAVAEADAQLPVQPVTALTTTDTPLRTLAAANANLVLTIPSGQTVQADALSVDSTWVRVVLTGATPDEARGGWVLRDQLTGDGIDILPVITEETRTPMQAFVFRTGLGGPVCQEAPNSLVIQGPTNTQVALNVNGADIVVGSTVQLTSVNGAPSDILENLDLPANIVDRLQAEDSNPTEETEGDECALTQMTVVSGEVIVNGGQIALPEGNQAYSVSCGQPVEETVDEGDAEATQSPLISADEFDVSYSSDWGSYQPLTEEELEALEPLEEISTTVLNYEISLPEVNEIQPPEALEQEEDANGVLFGVAEDEAATAIPTIVQQVGVPLRPTATVTPAATATALPPPTQTPLPADYAFAAAAEPVDGNGQTNIVGQPLPEPFVVRIVNAYGVGLNSIPVRFSAPNNGASGTFASNGTNTEVVYTNNEGLATSSAFTANTVAGSYTVVAEGNAVVYNGKPDIFVKPAFQSVLGFFSVTNLPDGPVSLAIVNGSGQSAVVATSFSTPVEVRALDGFGNGVPGVSITYAAPLGGASAIFSGSGTNTITVTTNGSGVANAGGVSANTVTGTYSVTVSSGSLPPVALTFTNTSGAPVALVITGGSGQSATVGTSFAVPFSAQVRDTYGNGVPGQSVTFTAPEAPATCFFVESLTDTQTTNSGGTATAITCSANGTVGAYNVVVTSGALSPVSISLTNTPGAPANVTIVSGDGQSTPVTTTFGAPFVVNVTDGFGNVVAPGTTVTFTPPGSGASGTFAGSNTAITDGIGNATSSSLFTANTVAGAYTLTASAGSGSAFFALTNTPGVASSIIVTAGDGQSTTVGTSFATAFSVQVRDVFSNIVPGQSVTFTSPGSGATCLFGGLNTSNQTTNAAGNVTAATCTANGTPGSYNVLVAAGIGSANISLTNNVGAPTAIVITAGSGQSTAVNTTFPTAFSVMVEDAFGNGVPGQSVTFTSPSSGASCLFSGVNTNNQTTDGAGNATAPSCAANNISGSYSVAVTSGALNASIGLTNTCTATVVSSLADSGAGSLRQAIADVGSGCTITFSVSGTITVSSELGINNKNVTINGGGAITLSGGGTSRIMGVDGTSNVTLNGLSFVNGNSNGFDAGALYVYNGAGTTVTINNSIFDGNVAAGLSCCEKGGAIFNEGNLIITNTTFKNNTGNQGSAIVNWVSANGFSVSNSCFINNNPTTDVTASLGTANGNWWNSASGPNSGGSSESISGITDSSFLTSAPGGVPGCF